MEKGRFKMKASYIINSIYSVLNEDKFSRLTVGQVYSQLSDEMGEEYFSTYLKDLCYKIFKSEKIYFLKTADSDSSTDSGVALLFQFKWRGYVESLHVVYSKKNESIKIDGWINYKSKLIINSGGFEISSDAVDIFQQLKTGIVNQCFKPEMVKERKKIEAEINGV